MSKRTDELEPIYIEHKYLAIPVVAKRAKELSRQYYQTHSMSDSGYDPLDAALKDMEESRLSVYKRNELTGELEPYT